MNVLTFEQLPKIVADLKNEVREMKTLLLQKAKPQPEPETPIGIKDVSGVTGYTLPTIYSYCRHNEIPYHKKNNRLFFFKSEIIDWIKTGRQKTLKELSLEADSYLSSK